ncbi:MAG: DUF2752 domain-containing protein [Ginsengibacter sp.]
MKTLFRQFFELTFWVVTLFLLAVMDLGTDPHYSFCALKFLGIPYCPGCGLGHSISYLFHGQFRQSLAAHPLGFFAVVVILHRIYKLSYLKIFSKAFNYLSWQTQSIPGE